jgi:DHA1 family tetracycline resistance protein-like MFS transporter
MSRRSARNAPAIGFILAVLVIDSLGFGLVIPILPTLIQKLSGGPRHDAALWVGVLAMCFAAAQFFTAPVLGQLSDRFGRRPLILISLTGSALNYVLLVFAPSIGWLFLGRLLAGATAGNVSAASAYIADITEPQDRARRFGLIGAAFSFGFIIGPALGGLLGGISLRLPFALAAGLAGVNALYGLFVLPESLPVEKRRLFRWPEATPFRALGTLGADPRMRRLAFAWAVRWFGLGTIQAVFVLSTELRFGWGPQQNGIALAVVGITGTLAQAFLVRRVVGWLGEAKAAMFGFAMNALAFAGFALAGQVWVIILIGLLQALGSVTNPAIRAMISSAAPSDRQGSTQGALAAVEGLTAIVSPLIGAGLFALFTERHGGIYFPGAPFMLAAGLFIVGAILVAAAARHPGPG